MTKFNVISKIHKYRGLQEGHHFIPMAMEVHGALEHDMYRFIRECACLFKIDDRKVIYPCIFAFNISSNMVVLLSSVF
jgi:hypothetical protein